MLDICPISLAEANAFVEEHHRHHKPVVGHKFSIGCTHGCAILRKAADRIERLTAENAALREKKRWISVTEKTPEYDMPQLALNADGEALIANYAYGEWFDTWGQDVEVTRWMPLPEATEEGDKA